MAKRPALPLPDLIACITLADLGNLPASPCTNFSSLAAAGIVRLGVTVGFAVDWAAAVATPLGFSFAANLAKSSTGIVFPAPFDHILPS